MSKSNTVIIGRSHWETSFKETPQGQIFEGIKVEARLLDFLGNNGTITFTYEAIPSNVQQLLQAVVNGLLEPIPRILDGVSDLQIQSA